MACRRDSGHRSVTPATAVRFVRIPGPWCCALVLAIAAAPAPARAAFHLMKVVEVFGGTPASPSAQYVVLQMYSAGQTVVDNHAVTLYDAAGVPKHTFTFEANVSNGANQAKILVATPQAATFFSVTADLPMTASLLLPGGKACFDNIDCVAWGNYTGSSSGVGAPFNPDGGLLPGRAAIRRLDGATGSPTALEGSDDTDDSSNDFRFGDPAPRNNANVAGTVPASVCGNSVIEGLEQCDDGNTEEDGTCSADCRTAPPPLVFANSFED